MAALRTERDPWLKESTDRPVAGPRRARARARALTLAALTTAVALTVGCDASVTRGQGAVKSEAREVGAFSRIDAGAGITVVVRIDPTATMEVRAQENLLPVIVTEVENATLRIHSAHGYTTSEPVEVVVTTPELQAILLSGGSHGTVDGLAADVVDIKLSGGSELTASGQASTVTLDISGGSTADLEALSAATISVDLTGGGRATVTASDRVQGAASGGARLTVLGGAQLSVDTSSDAQVTGG
jgi:hypothetical protein